MCEIARLNANGPVRPNERAQSISTYLKCAPEPFDPLEPLMLGERQQVTLTISDSIDARPHLLLVSPDEWSDAADGDSGFEEVGQALATIRGSLSEAVLEDRRER
jgi:hypothetical protein